MSAGPGSTRNIDLLKAGIEAAAPTTTAEPMGLSTGSVTSNYVQYPTYGDMGLIPGLNRLYETSTFPGAPASATDKSAPGAGRVRYAYYIATSANVNGVTPDIGPGGSSTGPMIGWRVMITGGPVPTNMIFKTRVDSYTTANSMAFGGYRYGSYTFDPEPPNYDGAYKFFFSRTAPVAVGGRRKAKRRKSRKSRKGTRRH